MHDETIAMGFGSKGEFIVWRRSNGEHVVDVESQSGSVRSECYRNESQAHARCERLGLPEGAWDS